MATRKTSLEIDDELFDDVRGILGTSTLRDTVHREEIDALSTMRGMDLHKPRIMSRAWRP